MNRKGFTLIELLATLLLLSVIVVISFVSINKITQKSKDNDCETIVNNIKSAVKEYASDYRYDNNVIVKDENNIIKFKDGININTLITKNYLSGDIYNPYDKKQKLNDSNAEYNKIIINVTFKNDYTVDTIDVTSNDEKIKEVLKCGK